MEQLVMVYKQKICHQKRSVGLIEFPRVLYKIND